MDVRANNRVTALALGLLMTPLALHIGGGSVLICALVILAFVITPGVLTFMRILFIRTVVIDGVEVRARTLEHRVTRGIWRESRVVRARFSYNHGGQEYEQSASLPYPERIPLKIGGEVVLLVDPRSPKLFVLRDLFVDVKPIRLGQGLGAIALPADGDSLWPAGKRILLQRFVGSYPRFRGEPVVAIINEKLIIAEKEEPDQEPEYDPDFRTPDGPIMGTGYEFYDGRLVHERSHAVNGIVRVALSPSIFRSAIAIWIADDSGSVSKVFKADILSAPRTFTDLAREVARQGILPKGPEAWNNRGIVKLAGQLLVRELENQFRRCAPQARIELRGRLMSEEDFRRIVK